MKTLMTELKAPMEWHYNNIILGKDKPFNSKQITTKKWLMQYSNDDDGALDNEWIEVPTEVISGSVGQYKVIEDVERPEDVDPSDFLDWRIENGYVEVVWEDPMPESAYNLLDFHSHPNTTSGERVPHDFEASGEVYFDKAGKCRGIVFKEYEKPITYTMEHELVKKMQANGLSQVEITNAINRLKDNGERT